MLQTSTADSGLPPTILVIVVLFPLGFLLRRCNIKVWRHWRYAKYGFETKTVNAWIPKSVRQGWVPLGLLSFPFGVVLLVLIGLAFGPPPRYLFVITGAGALSLMAAEFIDSTVLRLFQGNDQVADIKKSIDSLSAEISGETEADSLLTLYKRYWRGAMYVDLLETHEREDDPAFLGGKAEADLQKVAQYSKDLQIVRLGNRQLRRLSKVLPVAIRVHQLWMSKGIS